MPSGRLKLELEFDPEQLHKEKRRSQKEEICDQGHRAILKLARTIAKRSARRHPSRFCTADEVVEGLSKYGHCPSALGLAAGLVFRSPGWALTCYRVKSRRKTSHGREIKVWRWEGRKGQGDDQPSNLGILVDDSRDLGSLSAEAAKLAEVLAKEKNHNGKGGEANVIR